MTKPTPLIFAVLLCQVAPGAELKMTGLADGFRAEAGQVAIECSRDLKLRAFLRKNNAWVTLSASEGLPPAVSVKLAGGGEAAFSYTGSPAVRRGVKSKFGQADRVAIRAAGALALDLSFDFPARYPDVVVIESRFRNASRDRAVVIAEVRQAALKLARPVSGGEVLFWSLQGGGYKWGADWVLPVGAGFSQDNYTGPKGQGNGGGFPFVDLWRPEMGVAVALLDPKPALAWVPVGVSPDGAALTHVEKRPAARLAPGESWTPEPVMIAVHERDFYDPMVRYRQLMGDAGVPVVTEYEPDDYAPAWCTWGFQRNFTMDAMLAKVPQMREMGMADFILDDGWFDLFGNWRPTPQKFPGGEADMKAAIAKLHAAGLKFRLWWAPGSADPGSDIDREHPDWFILDRAGRKEKASWNAYYLCPSYAPVRQATRAQVRRFIQEWSVDSFKLDGTSLNHAPLCYNPAHRHVRPEESFEQWPGLFREIRQESRRLRPGFRIELCPCGITPTFQLAAAMEQPTDSDPYDHQVTYRTKFLKAMFGPRSPVLQEYVGLAGPDTPSKRNHVEIYPRAIGTGQVPSTFARELTAVHARWTAIYNRHRLAEGEYLNLYDIRWEPVEGHAIRKGSKLYYGFFTVKPGADYSGQVELRGLDKRRYRVTDYAAGRVIGEVDGPAASLPVRFEDALLLLAEPL
jgi:alpha-galactosidase